MFIDLSQSKAGKLQMTYVFTKGLHSGYIRTNGEKPKPPPMFGDPNDDGKVVPVALKVGDKVIASKYAGTEVKLDGAEYTIISEKDVLAVID